MASVRVLAKRRQAALHDLKRASLQRWCRPHRRHTTAENCVPCPCRTVYGAPRPKRCGSSLPTHKIEGSLNSTMGPRAMADARGWEQSRGHASPAERGVQLQLYARRTTVLLRAPFRRKRATRGWPSFFGHHANAMMTTVAAYSTQRASSRSRSLKWWMGLIRLVATASASPYRRVLKNCAGARFFAENRATARVP